MCAADKTANVRVGTDSRSFGFSIDCVYHPSENIGTVMPNDRNTS